METVKLSLFHSIQSLWFVKSGKVSVDFRRKACLFLKFDLRILCRENCLELLPNLVYCCEQVAAFKTSHKSWSGGR